jgi:hypothetical protein
MLRTFASLAAVAFWASCQSNAGTDLGGPNTGGGGSGSVPSRTFDAGGVGEVRISILQPTGKDAIKVGSATEVRARVTSVRPGSNDPGTDPIDPTSVKFSLRQQMTNQEVQTGTLFGPMANNEYAAPFDLSKAGTGDYVLVVMAVTTGHTSGLASVVVRIDSGPRINIISPVDGKSYRGGMTVQVNIDASPFGQPTNIMAFIGLVPVMLQKTGAANMYEATVVFNASTPPLDGEQVFRVSAENSESTATESKVRFLIDNKGPTFTLTEPKEGAVVGGIIRVRAKVADPAGVFGESIQAVIGNRKDVNFQIKLKSESEPGVFSELFDTTKLTSCKPLPDTSLCIVFPNLSFRGSDLAGNESVVAYDISVDNQPPVLDLFPPADLRIARYSQAQKELFCSWKFDPLGDYRRLGDMPDDGCAVPQVFDLRARIEDDGNRADGLKLSPISGTDPATTALYVLGDPNGKTLVVDDDGDGACDRINPLLVPTTKPPQGSNEVLAVRLAAIPPKGFGDFTPDPLLNPITGADRANYIGCNPGNDPLAPPLLCGSQNLTIIIGMPTANGPDPAIWTIEPFSEGEPRCAGSQFDSYANLIPEGWACVAAAATDRLGNDSVSQPLRVWIQYRGLVQSGPSCPAPPPSAGPPPDCTGTFDLRSGALTGGSCRGRAFRPRQILDQGALPEGGNMRGM